MANRGGCHECRDDCVLGSTPHASVFRAKITGVFAIHRRKAECYCFGDHIPSESRTKSVPISFSPLPKARRLIPPLINAGTEGRPNYGFGIKHRAPVNMDSLSKCQ